jgi:hypothetical protein
VRFVPRNDPARKSDSGIASQKLLERDLKSGTDIRVTPRIRILLRRQADRPRETKREYGKLIAAATSTESEKT